MELTPHQLTSDTVPPPSLSVLDRQTPLCYVAKLNSNRWSLASTRGGAHSLCFAQIDCSCLRLNDGTTRPPYPYPYPYSCPFPCPSSAANPPLCYAPKHPCSLITQNTRPPLRLLLLRHNRQASRLRAAFREHDKEKDGTVKPSQWVVVLRETKLSTVMTRQVAEAICLEHDTRADGTLDYAALCDDIFPGDFDHYAHQQHFVYKVGFASLLVASRCFAVGVCAVPAAAVNVLVVAAP